MAATFKQRGVIVIIVSLALGTLLILGTYFLSFAVTESKISKNQEASSRTYYLSEAGVNEAIWKLKNDETIIDGDDSWKICFSSSSAECFDCNNWQNTFFRKYTEDSTTTVTIENSQCAKGSIVATTTLFFAGSKTSQRVVKVKVLKSFGSLTENGSVVSGSPSGESNIQSSLMNIYNSNIFSNNNINIRLFSEVNVYDNDATGMQEGQVLANQNVNITLSTLQSSSTCSKNMCTVGVCEKCPVDSLEMPAVDFDSINSTSYKSKAQAAQSAGQCSVVGQDFSGAVLTTSNKCIFNAGEFEDLLWEIGPAGKLILEYKTDGITSSIYYVEGAINLKGQRYLEVNGVLIADSTINIGENFCWQSRCGFNQITINDPGNGIPSGLLTKGKINFGMYTSLQDVSIIGLVYSQDEMRLTSLPSVFTVTGAMMARKFTFSSNWLSVNIYFDNDIIREGIWGGPEPPGGAAITYSPIVTVEYWEESY